MISLSQLNNKALLHSLVSVTLRNRPSKSHLGDSSQNRLVAASTAHAPQSKHPLSGHTNKFRNISVEEVRHAKKTRSLSKWGKFGHWYKDHNTDGSLPAHFQLSEHSILSIKQNDVENPSTFNNGRVLSTLFNSSLSLEKSNIGPMLDNGAPCFALCYFDLYCLSVFFKCSSLTDLESAPKQFINRNRWQYDSGKHASRSRAILGFVFFVSSLNGKWFLNRHLVVGGLSQLVTGCNVTSCANMFQLDGNYIDLSSRENQRL